MHQLQTVFFTPTDARVMEFTFTANKIGQVCRILQFVVRHIL